MIYLIIFLLGLCFGSFINALVWRVNKQEGKNNKDKRGSKSKDVNYSILNGRSMCPNCKHILSGSDLIPILSYISLRGKCRYCKRKISKQYPVVELMTGLIFIISYIYWPSPLNDFTNIFLFSIWLILLVGLIALFIYDLKWFLLPNRIMFPLFFIGFINALILFINSYTKVTFTMDLTLAILIGGGIFYLIFQFSNGLWIGGGDVKLGFLIGLILASASKTVLALFLAALLGCIITIPLLTSHKLKVKSKIPFGPFLIFGLILAQLFGTSIINWYQSLYFYR
jgi:prepilin signal peptidase PulO-like enzyme (type II secretory pathway)